MHCSAMYVRLRRIFLLLSVLAASITSAYAISPKEVRWGDEGVDISRLESVLAKAKSAEASRPAEYVVKVGREFLGTPYVAGTLEGSPEMLGINTSGLDCTTFVDITLALAKAAGEGVTTWEPAAEILRDMRYRKGSVDGYASRFHYISDWITNNVYNGVIREVTSECPGAKRRPETLDFMSHHRDAYPALTDSLTFERIKSVEQGLRGLNNWMVPKNHVGRKDVASFLRDGDIVFITTSMPGLDVSHAGIIVKSDDGLPHLMHASSTAGKVIIDPLPLDRYLSRNKSMTGIRVVRLQ